jgi:hypothetical protein
MGYYNVLLQQQISKKQDHKYFVNQLLTIIINALCHQTILIFAHHTGQTGT